MDEVHFQQHGSRCRMWIAPEVKDPVLLHHPTRKSVGYFGAVRLRDGKFVFAREQDRFDAATTWAFLRLLHRRSRQRQRRVVVITDNAKYHHATLHRNWRQEHERSFQLDFLAYKCESSALCQIRKGEHMKTLPETFRSDDFEFQQLRREGMVALFRKSKPEF